MAETPIDKLPYKWRTQRDLRTPKPAPSGRASWRKVREKSQAGLLYDHYELRSPMGRRLKVDGN
jgi:hypothetical protein